MIKNLVINNFKRERGQADDGVAQQLKMSPPHQGPSNWKPVEETACMNIGSKGVGRRQCSTRVVLFHFCVTHLGGRMCAHNLLNRDRLSRC